LATQSAGCENAGAIGDAGIPLLLFHGERDELLPPMVSEMVHAMAGCDGELVLLPGTGHLLSEVGAELRERLERWIPERFDDARPPDG
jgi:pimeloyl-ACP methyl ester carboxylesterase